MNYILGVITLTKKKNETNAHKKLTLTASDIFLVFLTKSNIFSF